jgi:hypothetical protein
MCILLEGLRKASQDSRSVGLDELNVRFEVFTAMTMKNVVFWDVAACRYFVNRRFGGKYRLHLQGRRNPRTINQREQVAVDCSLRRLTKYLHGATSQKTAFFI